MVQIFLAYGITKESVTAIILFCKNTNAMVHSPDGDPGFFEIVVGILQGDILVPFLFIICQDYELRDQTKENNFTLKRQEAVNIPLKGLLMKTTLMILRFFQIHLLKPNLCYLTWSKQQDILVST